MSDDDLNNEIFIEEVTESIGRHILASNVLPLDTGAFVIAKERYEKTGKCTCSNIDRGVRLFVRDECKWMYDFRFCAICGEGLGSV